MTTAERLDRLERAVGILGAERFGLGVAGLANPMNASHEPSFRQIRAEVRDDLQAMLDEHAAIREPPASDIHRQSGWPDPISDRGAA